MIGETKLIARVCVYSSITAIALISIKYSGDVILQTSTIVEAGAGALKYWRRTLWICSKCSMLPVEFWERPGFRGAFLELKFALFAKRPRG